MTISPERPRTPIEHELKTWPDFFRVVESGEKTFEVRKHDRDFHAGDTLWLREWRAEQQQYTGRECRVDVTYLLAGNWPGLQADYVVMAIRKRDVLALLPVERETPSALTRADWDEILDCIDASPRLNTEQHHALWKKITDLCGIEGEAPPPDERSR